MTKENRPSTECLKEIGNRMRLIRDQLDLQQETLARALTITRTTLSTIENGKIGPSFDVMMALFQKFDINIHYLLDGKGEMFRSNAMVMLMDGLKKQMNSEDNKFLKYYFQSDIVRLDTLSKFSMMMIREGALIEHEIEQKKAQLETKTKG